MKHKYLHRRGDNFHFRWRVPADLRTLLGLTEFTHSLRTCDPNLAVARAGRFTLFVDGITRIRRAYLAHDIDAREYLSELKHLLRQRLSMSRRKKDTLKVELITAGNLIFDFAGDVDKELEAVSKAKEMGLLPETLDPKQPDSKGVGPLFSEVFLGFLEHKKNVNEAAKEGRKPLSMSIQNEHKRNFDKLIAVMGDKPIGSITQRELKDAILICGNLPKMNKNPYKGMPVAELLEMDIPEEDRISGKTTLEIKKMAQGIFAFAVGIAGHIDVSPATGMNLGDNLNASRTFGPYTDDEVNTILTASFEESEAWRKWIPWLAAYTGARRGELAQLRKQDIRCDQKTGREYILITDDAGSIKNENAKRQIPLHPILVEKGFMGFVEGANERLFSDLDPESITRWFMPLLSRLEIDKTDDYGNRKVFHSLRHTFITKSRSAGNVLDHIQQVVGHEKTSAGVTDRYSHNHPLKDVLDVVDKVSFE